MQVLRLHSETPGREGEAVPRMQGQPAVVRTVAALRAMLARYRAAGEDVALVPTMGALHQGHTSLVRLAAEGARRVVVSVFVNPAQFAPSEDFASYPRDFEADLAALATVRADIVWAPAVETMYPREFATYVVPEGPATAGLEDAHRPHFFKGVATIVAKLLLQCLPDVAVFGEKDYQQLKVVTRMIHDLDIPSRILGAPTVREPDGLAMSSRNVHLSSEQRAIAPVLYRTLTQCADEVAAGVPIEVSLSKAREAMARAGFVTDYFEARHAETLLPIRSVADGPIRLLAAARLGTVRLIDNIGMPDA